MYMKNNGMKAYICVIVPVNGISETSLLIGIALCFCQLFESQRYKFINYTFNVLFVKIIRSVVFI